jgi:hypothetical protein
MQVFGGRVGTTTGAAQTPSLEDPEILSLLYAAVDSSNYQAVVALYNRYARTVRPDELWDTWLDQAADAAHGSRTHVARLALSFARMAAVEPWGALTTQQRTRIRALDAVLSAKFS